jgi:hypothetical protein
VYLPLPLIAALVGAVITKATNKPEKRQAVSKYKKKNGTKVKSYARKPPALACRPPFTDYQDPVCPLAMATKVSYKNPTTYLGNWKVGLST